MKTNLNLLFKNRTHVKKNHGGITVSFDENVKYICSEIKKSKVVIGCAPWFSNKKIFDALTNVSVGVSIILDKSTVNKYIRSNSASWMDHQDSHRNLSSFKFKPLPFNLSMIPTDFEFADFEGDPLNKCSFRVVGRNQKNQKHKTLFHYKFLVFCEANTNNGIVKEIIPKSVICGSFNFSDNSEQSREALLHIDNMEVAQEFYNEWARAFMLSENIERYSKNLDPEFLPANTEEEVIRLLEADCQMELMLYAYEHRLDNDAAMIDRAAAPYR